MPIFREQPSISLSVQTKSITIRLLDGTPAIHRILNPFTAGAANIQVSIFYKHIMYHHLNMLKIKCDINQQYLKTVDLHFVKSQ